MNKSISTKKLVLLGMMSGLLILMAFTPLGYLNIGLLAITLNIIPVAISIVAAGYAGGLVTGGLFGITSCLQCIGIGGTSAMGAALFAINPWLTFLHRFGSRLLTGLVVSLIYKLIKNKTGNASYFITGFCSAFFNTLFFMSTLILFFYNSDYVQGLMGGKNVILFVCSFVGINAVFEMIASCLVTGGVCSALKKGSLID